MITAEKWKLVTESLDSMMECADTGRSVADIMMLAPESPIFARNDVVCDKLLAALELLIGDKDETLTWYAYECDYGRNPLLAGLDGDMRPIDTHERLRWLLDTQMQQQATGA